MKFWRLNKVKIIIVPAVILLLATGIFMMVYALNPWREFFYFFKSMNQSMQDKAAPELIGIETWLNTPNNQPLSLAALRGQVVLIDFWTYACINCQRDAPFLVAWDKKYRDWGFVIIGVHTPEFRFEKNLANVRQAMAEYQIEYPVALDNDYQTWRAYGNRFWPAKYLIDKGGRIVYMRFGEGG